MDNVGNISSTYSFVFTFRVLVYGLFQLISLRDQSIKYTYLKCDLSKTTSTFDVETEDRQSHVQLILNSLFACIELLPLVDVLATCFTPSNNQRGNTVTGLIHRSQKVLIMKR